MYKYVCAFKIYIALIDQSDCFIWSALYYLATPRLHSKPPEPHSKPPGLHSKPPGLHSKPPGPHSKPPGFHSKLATRRPDSIKNLTVMISY